MSYCSNCGYELQAGMKFCPSCGTQISENSTETAISTYTTTVPVSTYVNSDFSGVGLTNVSGYNIVLVNVGTCDINYADDVLVDLFGYSSAQSQNLVAQAPVLIAQSLTKKQALYAAQALTEYGMQVSVYDENGYVNLDSDAVGSVFKNDGSLLSKVAIVLGTIGIANQVRRLIKWNTPNYLSNIFRPSYKWENPFHLRKRFKEPRREQRPAPKHSSPKPNEMHMSSHHSTGPNNGMSGNNHMGGNSGNHSGHGGGQSGGHGGPGGRR